MLQKIPTQATTATIPIVTPITATGDLMAQPLPKGIPEGPRPTATATTTTTTRTLWVQGVDRYGANSLAAMRPIAEKKRGGMPSVIIRINDNHRQLLYWSYAPKTLFFYRYNDRSPSNIFAQ